MNTLYYGDNLKILREYIPAGSVDLVYLDPPFNSNRNYNVLFKNESGVEAESQITALEDTWHWNLAAEQTRVSSPHVSKGSMLDGDPAGALTHVRATDTAVIGGRWVRKEGRQEGFGQGHRWHNGFHR